MIPVRIDIEDIEIFAHHGVLAQETVAGNRFLVSITVEYDGEAAIATDDIGCAVNYAEIVAVVKEVFSRPSALLEHIAGRIRDAIKAACPAVLSGSVTVVKPAPPIPTPLGGVSVTLKW